MSRFSHYGSGQRLAFAMLCVGFSLCLVGAVVPFWIKSEVQLSDVTSGFFNGFLTKLTQRVGLLKFNLGIWVFCLETIASDTKCYNMYGNDVSLDDDHEEENLWIQVVRIAVAINIKLSLISGLAACCRCMCCSGGRTICHGVLAFLSGGFGILAIAIMASHKDDLVLGLSLFEMEFDWGFFVYAIGSGLLILSSLFLCFSLPREMPGGMVFMAGGAPYVNVTTSNVSQNVIQAPTNQYELNGHIQSFEPMPQPSAIQQPSPPPY